MKSTPKWLILFLSVSILSACIQTTSPENLTVQLQSGQSQFFMALSSEPQAVLNWYLDGDQIATDAHGYEFTAEWVPSGEAISHHLEVREEWGPHSGLVNRVLGVAYTDAISWEISIIPSGTPKTLRCYLDEDGDGYGDSGKMQFSNTGIQNCVADNTDCNDDIADIHPGGIETCNGLDDNCDGQVDEGVLNTYYADTDGDNYGASNDSIKACTPPAHYVSDGTDCDDTNSAIHPGAAEIRNDGLDNDCKGGDYCPTCQGETYYRDADGDGFGNPKVSVAGKRVGYVRDYTDCNDTDPAVHPGTLETCNGVDDNCNSQIDEGLRTTFYQDGDGDGYGIDDPAKAILACTVPKGYVASNTDCNDGNPGVNPSAQEVCNNIDDDCNGIIDDGLKLNVYYEDNDGDGYGNPQRTGKACLPPPGWVTNRSDCDDSAGAVHPGASESCNALDDNCDGTVDEGLLHTYFLDADNDGYGNPKAIRQGCAPPENYVTDASDCDDNTTTIHAGATEMCNGVDDNCNGQVDEGVLKTYYRDLDNDGYGDPKSSQEACDAPNFFVADNSDCDDTNAAIHPDANETCNGSDDNCNGEEDEGVKITYYRDVDNDGYGTPDESMEACLLPAGYVAASKGGDCNDSDAASHPGAKEICNKKDDDCNGKVDDTQDDVDCNNSSLLSPPKNVVATDSNSGLPHVNVTWQSSENAAYYLVYRSPWVQNGTYEKVSGKVTGTSFTYKQSWDDTFNRMGPGPTMKFTADMKARELFINDFDTYMTKSFPILSDFKAPAYFKVMACNDMDACSDLSSADAGRAEFIHTPQFSEVAELFVPLFQYPMLRALATIPTGEAALSWCGADLCGTGGGIVMSRIDTNALQINLYYENYTNAWCSGTDNKTKTFMIDGYFGGVQSANDVLAGKLKVSGDFDFDLGGSALSQVFAWASINGSTGRNEGYISVSYNNNRYQFNLPLQPINRESVGNGPRMKPVKQAKDDYAMDVNKQATTYPDPLTDPMFAGCTGITTGVVNSCTRIPY